VDWLNNKNEDTVAPILVLGLGNILLGDDGVGPAAVQEVRKAVVDLGKHVECVDGGTQGLALLGYFSGRRALIIIDALAGGKPPGTISVLGRSQILGCGTPRSTTGHEGNASELLILAHLLEELPESIFIVGVEPESLHTRHGLSASVTAALPAAVVRTCEIVEQVLIESGEWAVA
jgi:hydrogenase maturation protease